MARARRGISRGRRQARRNLGYQQRRGRFRAFDRLADHPRSRRRRQRAARRRREQRRLRHGRRRQAGRHQLVRKRRRHPLPRPRRQRHGDQRQGIQLRPGLPKMRAPTSRASRPSTPTRTASSPPPTPISASSGCGRTATATEWRRRRRSPPSPPRSSPASSLAGTPTNLPAAAGSAVAINTGQFTRTDGTQGMFSDAALSYFSGRPARRRGSIVGPPVLRPEEPRNIRSWRRAASSSSRSPRPRASSTRARAGSAPPPCSASRARRSECSLRSSSTSTATGWRWSLATSRRPGSTWTATAAATIPAGSARATASSSSTATTTASSPVPSELSFLTEKPGARSDLDALSALDSNRDRKIDATDLRFGELKVWVDSNRNGVTDAGELKTLQELNIASIGLAGRADRAVGQARGQHPSGDRQLHPDRRHGALARRRRAAFGPAAAGPPGRRPPGRARDTTSRTACATDFRAARTFGRGGPTSMSRRGTFGAS